MDSSKILIIVIVAIVSIALFFLILYFVSFTLKKKTDKEAKKEIQLESVEELANYVRIQKEKAEQEERLKDLRKEEMNQKLELFKQTKEELKDKLKAQIDAKEWVSLDTILKSIDKGGVGVYVIFNKDKNKYYVGQSKQIFQRIRKHFKVEDIAKDFISGDSFYVKYLTANELDSDYRIDHIEKTGIEIFESGIKGYNKTAGNI